MKILIAIPHYYNPENDRHGSGRKNPLPRINALSACLFNLHSLFGNSQYILNIISKTAIPANQNLKHQIDVVICTANQKHILEHLNLPKDFYTQHDSTLENPKMLGFECHKIL